MSEPKNEITDPLADVFVGNVIRDRIHRAGLSGRPIVDEVLDVFAVRFERWGCLRRPVLYGDWEVDPSAVAERPRPS